jgi:PAS domain S-box-containing protein
MNEHSSDKPDWKAIRDKVIGLGEDSFRKSYYPELQQRLIDLQESEARFRAIFDSVSDAIFVHDPETGAILDANERVLHLWGYTRDEIRKLDVGALSSGENGNCQETAVQLIRQVAAGEPMLVEWQAHDSRGRRFWIDARLEKAVIAGEDRVLVVARDITDRKVAQEALEESEAQLRTLINSMPDIVCFKDGEGRWVEANEFDLNLFGLTGVDYRGKKDSELAEFSEFYRDAFLGCEETDEAAWRAGKPSRADEIIPRPDGDARIFDIVKVPTYFPDGSRKGLVVIGRDITDRKRAEEQQHALEEHKRRFYRDTILSVTDGKLEICDLADTEPYVAAASANVCVNQPADARGARLRALDVFCMHEEELGEFAVAIGEAVSNMLKHAAGGSVYAGKSDNEVWVVVRDTGPGIESIILPSAVLRRGFSTKPSMGMGFSIMLAASDRILLNTGQEGTTVVLIKDIREREPLLLRGERWVGDLASS